LHAKFQKLVANSFHCYPGVQNPWSGRSLGSILGWFTGYFYLIFTSFLPHFLPHFSFIFSSFLPHFLLIFTPFFDLFWTLFCPIFSPNLFTPIFHSFLGHFSSIFAHFSLIFESFFIDFWLIFWSFLGHFSLIFYHFWTIFTPQNPPKTRFRGPHPIFGFSGGFLPAFAFVIWTPPGGPAGPEGQNPSKFDDFTPFSRRFLTPPGRSETPPGGPKSIFLGPPSHTPHWIISLDPKIDRFPGCSEWTKINKNRRFFDFWRRRKQPMPAWRQSVPLWWTLGHKTRIAPLVSGSGLD